MRFTHHFWRDIASGASYASYTSKTLTIGFGITLAKASKNLENNQCNDFEKEMRVATVFLQQMVYKMSLKQGFKEEEIKQLYTMIQKKFN